MLHFISHTHTKGLLLFEVKCMVVCGHAGTTEGLKIWGCNIKTRFLEWGARAPSASQLSLPCHAVPNYLYLFAH